MIRLLQRSVSQAQRGMGVDENYPVPRRSVRRSGIGEFWMLGIKVCEPGDQRWKFGSPVVLLAKVDIFERAS